LIGSWSVSHDPHPPSATSPKSATKFRIII
jgi:hypothetical protein